MKLKTRRFYTLQARLYVRESFIKSMKQSHAVLRLFIGMLQRSSLPQRLAKYSTISAGIAHFAPLAKKLNTFFGVHAISGIDDVPHYRRGFCRPSSEQVRIYRFNLPNNGC